MTTSSVDQQIRSRLGDAGVRYTTGRQRVTSALVASDGPRSAAELQTQLGSAIPLSSLYRSLAVMASAGVLAPHHGSQGVTRYELAEWLSGHHHHLVCIDCGSVDDIELPDALEATLHELVDTVADEGHFVALGHALEVEGRCKACK
ncbi:MAG: transcriptional repressor [bacterium]|nr:transcriptional repressor [bacterium]